MTNHETANNNNDNVEKQYGFHLLPSFSLSCASLESREILLSYPTVASSSCLQY